MKLTKNKSLAVFAALALNLLLTLNAVAQGTTFTYQGRLTLGTNAPSGSFDFRFALFDSAEGGLQVGSTLINQKISVAQGLFTAPLDFGANIFNGQPRWLELAVRTNGTDTAFVPMTPRQALTPTPYAIHAGSADTVANGAINSAAIANGAVTADKLGSGAVSGDKLAAGAVVKSLNGLTDAVTLQAGANITLTPGAGGLTIAATPSLGIPGINNVVGNATAAVGGGEQNSATGTHSLVGGGIQNAASADASTVGGGFINQASDVYATVGGGRNNHATKSDSTIAGGRDNSATGVGATIPGGVGNVAAGPHSFAAGINAKANHQGSFVWADSSAGVEFASTDVNQFLVRAANGFGINTASTPDQGLEVNGPVHTEDYDYFFRAGSDHNHGIGWYGETKPFGSLQPDGPVLYGFTGGALGTLNGGKKAALQWDASGVQVNGRLKAATLGGINFSQHGAGHEILTHAAVTIEEFGVFKPADGFLLITGTVNATPKRELWLELVDVTGPRQVLVDAYMTGASGLISDSPITASLSIQWVIPVTAGGYINLALTGAIGDGGDAAPTEGISISHSSLAAVFIPVRLN